MMSLEEQFRSRVSAFLERTRLSPTRFGRMALGDPSLVRRIECGRSLTLRTADRILAFATDYDRKSGGTRDPPRRPRYRKPSPRAGRTNRSRATTDQMRNERTNPPSRILRLSEVQARTGLSRTTIYELRVEGRFPQPVGLGARSVGWIESEVNEWVRERIAESRSGAEGLSQGRINAALGQVMAHQAVEQASRLRQAELARLEHLAEWRESRIRANAFAETMRTAASRNRDALRDGLLFRIPSFYTGN